MGKLYVANLEYCCNVSIRLCFVGFFNAGSESFATEESCCYSPLSLLMLSDLGKNLTHSLPLASPATNIEYTIATPFLFMRLADPHFYKTVDVHVHPHPPQEIC